MITLALAQMIYFLAVQFPFTTEEEEKESLPRGSRSLLDSVLSVGDGNCTARK